MILLEYGADPLMKDDSGQTAIDVGKICWVGSASVIPCIVTWKNYVEWSYIIVQDVKLTTSL